MATEIEWIELLVFPVVVSLITTLVASAIQYFFFVKKPEQSQNARKQLDEGQETFEDVYESIEKVFKLIEDTSLDVALQKARSRAQNRDGTQRYLSRESGY